jgi:hypothetical protein
MLAKLDDADLDAAAVAAISRQLQQLTQAIDFEGAKKLLLGRQQVPPQLYARPAWHEAGLWSSYSNSYLQLTCLSLHGNGLVTLPEMCARLRSLRHLDLSQCSRLEKLPTSVGKMEALRWLDLSGCRALADLPEEFCNLAELQELRMSGCSELAELPHSFGRLQRLSVLDLSECTQLAALPHSMTQLELKTINFEGCSLLESWLPPAYLEASPQDKIRHLLDAQHDPAVIQLTTQQDNMLTTLERMSWLAVLLATATFIAFMQPPGGFDEGRQVLVSNSTACAAVSTMVQDAAARRSCALLVFFVLDAMSFGFSIGCVTTIIVMSMPRVQYHDDLLEAGRFWILLLLTWVLLYCAVLTGFGAFIASGLSVYNMTRLVAGPLVPGIVLLFFGVIAIAMRFKSLYPGKPALQAAFMKYVCCQPRRSRKKYAKHVPRDVEMGQSMFWRHCSNVLSPGAHEPAWPVTVLAEEATPLLTQPSQQQLQQQQQQQQQMAAGEHHYQQQQQQPGSMRSTVPVRMKKRDYLLNLLRGK